jgi:tetratricopeptide (TPR) repeat protein
VGLPSEQRLGRGSIAIETLTLTPQDFFVLSRVEGTSTVRELVASTGLSATQTEQIIGRLVELGALVPIEDQQSEPGPSPSPSPVRGRPSTQLRDQARERRRRMLQAQLGRTAAAAKPERSAPRATESPAPSPESATEDGQGEDAPEIELVPADDPRIDATLAIPVADQRLVLTLHDRCGELGPFALLGIAPTHDTKAIRRAYHSTSRRLHPDAYYGRNLGSFRDLLTDLFRRVKVAHGQLQDEEVRAPWVDARLEEEASRHRAREERRRTVLEAEEARRRELEAQARSRRQTRAAERIESERKRFEASKRSEAQRLRAEAEAAERAGELAKAANLYRLALQCAPDDAELRGRWQACRNAARAKRAASAFSRAISLVEIGQSAEAMRSFVEAADAHPTAEHLAHAAEALGSIDPVKARDYAMAALEALGTDAEKVGKSAAQRGLLHLMIGRAFLAAGQRESARQQALVAQGLRPNDAQVRALLNSTKVT